MITVIMINSTQSINNIKIMTKIYDDDDEKRTKAIDPED